MSKGVGTDLAISAVDAVTKFALDTIPSMGPIKAGYELIKFVSDNFGMYQEARNARRAEEFHRGLLNGAKTLIGDMLDVEDYHALLKACLADIEGEKSDIYGRFARAIAAGKVNEKYKKYLMVSLSQITYQQLYKLRQGWIASNYTLVQKDENGSISPKKFLMGDKDEIMDEMDHESLSVKKLVKEGALTKLGCELVESCFSRDQLLPQSINEVSWVGGALDVVTAESLNHSAMEQIQRLISLMHSSLVKANLHNPMSQFVRSELLEVLPFCVVIVRDCSLFREHSDAIVNMVDGRETILAFIGKRDEKVIKLLSAVEVFDCDVKDQQARTDMTNKVNQAVRRKVKLAKKS